MDNLTEKYSQYRSKEEKANPNYLMLKNEWDNYNYFVLQGGTRSGKSYSILKHLWDLLQLQEDKSYLIIRYSASVLIGTIIPDFVEIGRHLGLYNVNNHSLNQMKYTHNNNEVLFISEKEYTECIGRKADVIYFNEAFELSYDFAEKLLEKKGCKYIFDFGVSYTCNWLEEKIFIKDKACYLKTSFLDNPYITQDQIDLFNWLKEHDIDTFIQHVGEV